ncbi:hypothetical protein [Agromyces sp. NPDC058110]|uniref:hypothetical protein n=1 Tax=Agromyces sp. NPDC058110 TaxID=3346345 RepID=UPI0036DD6A00
MKLSERADAVCQALLAGSAIGLEENIALSIHRERWLTEHGGTLVERWHAVDRPGWPRRYLFESHRMGRSTWDAPDEEVVAVFTIADDDFPVRTALLSLREELAETPFLDRDVQRALMGIDDAVQVDRRSWEWETLDSLSAAVMPAAWGVEWPSSGAAPLEELGEWLEHQRSAVALDGQFFGGVGAVFEMLRRLGPGANRGSVAEPLRDGGSGSALRLLRQVLRRCIEEGEIEVVARVALECCESPRERLVAAPDVSAHAAVVYEVVPQLIAGASLASWFADPQSPLSEQDRTMFANRARRAEEETARLGETRHNAIRDLLGGGAARRQHVKELARVELADRERALDDLIERRFFYPRSARAGLLEEAAWA